jgi:hypothetical protein
VAELVQVERRLAAIGGGNRDPSIPVPNRVRLFMTTNSDLTFAPKELMEAIGATEDSVRKALTFLTHSGFLIRTDYATYAIDPHKGALDYESARALQGWYNVGDR